MQWLPRRVNVIVVDFVSFGMQKIQNIFVPLLDSDHGDPRNALTTKQRP